MRINGSGKKEEETESNSEGVEQDANPMKFRIGLRQAREKQNGDEVIGRSATQKRGDFNTRILTIAPKKKSRPKAKPENGSMTYQGLMEATMRHLFHWSARDQVAWCSCECWTLWNATKESAFRSFVLHRSNAGVVRNGMERKSRTVRLRHCAEWQESKRVRWHKRLNLG